MYFEDSFTDKIPLGTIYSETGYRVSRWETSKTQYYKLVVNIAKILPDDGSEEMARSALNIATAYSIMDFFDQYTYAQVSAQMIAEIGYTEIITITSTAISAASIVLGSYAVGALQGAARAATSILVKELVKKVVIGTIREKFL